MSIVYTADVETDMHVVIERAGRGKRKPVMLYQEIQQTEVVRYARSLCQVSVSFLEFVHGLIYPLLRQRVVVKKALRRYFQPPLQLFVGIVRTESIPRALRHDRQNCIVAAFLDALGYLFDVPIDKQTETDWNSLALRNILEIIFHSSARG